jgi:preprotein translocase subunit SecA
MFSYLAKKVFGTANDRYIKSLKPIIKKINEQEESLQALSDAELKAKTEKFRARLREDEGIEAILPEAFAVVREAARRVLGLRHYDTQLIGGIILHRGMISEMRTGEGKTLVATLPAYLNALKGKGVHIVTVNDYLASRDAAWMGRVYEFLGLSVGCVTSEVDGEDRKAAYEADITFGTNNEFGFDYLRDNLKYSTDMMVQRPFHFAIVDEVDSILIDEARTPLVISGPAEDDAELYLAINKIVLKMAEGDYDLDEKSRNVVLTDKGNDNVEQLCASAGLLHKGSGLYDIENMAIVHHINQALRAQKLFKRDVDYIVKDGQVMIIDEFTGRVMDGRRYSDGLHQAIEAKEGVPIQRENQTIASITYQNYFRMYPKLAGMTGSAMTEADEFMDIYKLSVYEVPTYKPVARKDEDDIIYRTAAEKYKAIMEEITAVHKHDQPILVGTTSIEKSEYISKMLKKAKIAHTVLNARYHEQEAQIIAAAGRLGAVTIATNMAGRGTDIQLGGNADAIFDELRYKDKKASDEKLRAQAEKMVVEEKEKVIATGGLYVLGTERHESRRIDNQLRGRSGRQGDAGRTRFYLSLEDDLMRLFGSEKISSFLVKLGLKEGESIVHPWISRSLEKAQKKVEARNYDMRKNLLKFDDVMNSQRQVVYQRRNHILSNAEQLDDIIDMADDVNESLVSSFLPAKSMPEEWDVEGLKRSLQLIYGEELSVAKKLEEQGLENDDIIRYLNQQVERVLLSKRSQYGEELVKHAECQLMLITLDQLWKDHLHNLDHLRTGIGLRAYGQKDPLNEYKREAFTLFKDMMYEFSKQSLQRLTQLRITQELEMQERRNIVERHEKVSAIQPDFNVLPHGRKRVAADERDPNDPESWGKISRNEICPCGSGKKYKQCHGKVAA